jgi:hypothetical protein
MARASNLAAVLEAAVLAGAIQGLAAALTRGATLALPGALRDPAPGLLLALAALGARVALVSDEETAGLSRWRPGRWFFGAGWPALVLAAGLAAAFEMQHRLDGRRLASEGWLHFAALRSAVVDGDLDLRNELAWLPAPHADRARASGVLQTGRVAHEPGLLLLWAPAYLVAHLVHSAGLGGEFDGPDGFSPLHVNAVGLAALAWAFVAVVVAYRLAAKHTSPLLASTVVVAAWFASTLLWYAVVEPTMPHASATGIVAVFLALWLRARQRRDLPSWLALAAVGGLVVSTQRYDAYWLLLPALTVARHLPSWLEGVSPRRALFATSLAAGALLIGLSPLVLYDRALAAQTSLLPADPGSFALRHWREPRLVEFLWSSNHGVFSWTPVVFLAVLGLTRLWWRERELGATLLVTLAAGVWLLSSSWDWHGGDAFGSRRLTEAFPLVALGLALLAEWLLRRPGFLVAGFLCPLVLWNLLLVEQVRGGAVAKIGGASFREASQRSLDRLYGLVGHPPSFPWPSVFAWRYGVGPDRFDDVFGRVPWHQLAANVGTPDDVGIVGRGWSGPERWSDGGPFRWSVAPESSWLITLATPADRVLTVTLQPSRHPEGHAQTVFVRGNGTDLGRWTLLPDLQARSLDVPAAIQRAGLNELVFRYAWTVRAGDAYGGDDARTIAVRATRLELRLRHP